MPLIEELPVASTIKASHGWAYVPDTGPIAAQQPGIRDRKRAAAVSSKHTATATAKQQKAIQQRLDSLNKENYKDGVTVPIPARPGASAREKAGKKMTPNVRRILTYQRGFAHYLADEEANNPGGMHYQMPNLASGMGPPPTPAAALTPTPDARSQRNTSKEDGRRKSGTARTRAITNETSVPSPSTPAPQPGRRKRGRPSSRATLNVEAIESPAPTEQEPHVKSEDTDTPMVDVGANADSENAPLDPSKSQTQPQPQPDHEPASAQPDYPPEWDLDPLLATMRDDVPRMPSEKIMQLLMSEPPLTYNAARATPLEPEKQRPTRHFCGVCGYWGRVKCKKCEEWTCGIMECWRGHEAVCVMANLYG